jgi:hypothetical protein
MAAVAAAGPLTMVAALTGPEIKKPRTPAGPRTTRRQPLPTKALGKRLRVCLAKQDTTKSLSSRHREYVSGPADRAAAAQNMT